MDVVAGFRERDALDPINGVNLGITRIAVMFHPLFDAVTARVVGGKRQDVASSLAGASELKLSASLMRKPLVSLGSPGECMSTRF